jgi:diguanylate cyclase (GGDEF)-like protein
MLIDFAKQLQRVVRSSAVVAFGGIIIVLLWLGVYVKYQDGMQSAQVEATRETANLSLLFEENVLRSIGEIDKALLYLRHSIQAQRAYSDLATIVNSTDLQSEIIVQVAVIDANGIMRATNAGPQPAPALDLSDREHFRHHVNSTTDELYISAPVIGRASRRWSVQLTRRLTDENGTFAGVVVASLDPHHLTTFYSRLHFGSSTAIAVLGDDGIVRSTGGGGTSPRLGTNLSHAADFVEARAKGGVTLEETNPVSGQKMLTAFRPVRGQPLWVMASRNLADDFALPRASLYRNALAAGFLTLVILFALARIYAVERNARKRAEQLSATLDNMIEGIMLVAPDNTVQVVNENCRQLLVLPSPRTSDDKAAYDDIIRQVRGSIDGTKRDGVGPVIERAMPDGALLEIRSNAMADGGIVCTISDITERRKAEMAIVQLAAEDPLTGLPNRRSFTVKLRQMLDQQSRTKRTPATSTDGARAPIAVMFLDIDRFKNINDSLGHRIGDLFLVEVGERLKALHWPSSGLARLGGDEFAIALPDIGSNAEIEGFAQSIIRTIARPFEINGYRIATTTSIGIALAESDRTTVDELIAAADLALYHAKSQQRGTYSFYSPAMSASLDERRRIEMDLRQAIETGGLELHYQPLLCLQSGKISGFEALARWRHPEKGVIPPDTFIPVAEETGLIVALGEWALKEACRTAATWPNRMQIAVNVSPIQLMSHDFAAVTHRILTETGLQPGQLEIEVTERILMQEGETTDGALAKLKALGTRIVLDDFGTGYSSLSYLRTFSFDKVKIDRSFISDLALGTERTVIVQAVMSITKALGMQTTAEGVETDYQRDLLKALGCDQAQGYFISRPMPASAIGDFLTNWQADQAEAARRRVS